MAEKKAKKQKKWTRRYHKGVFAVLRGIFGIHTKIRYNYSAEKSKLKPPFLIMCNHVTTFDPVFIALSFKCPIYFCATDDMFNMPVVSPLLRSLVAPIPKMKGGMDMQAIRDCVKVLKEGGAVGIFPEGNRTLSSGLWQMTGAVAKFIKMSKATLVLYNIEGGYGSDPRWGVSKRKGKMRGYVKKTLTVEEYMGMSNDELYKTVCDNLAVPVVTGVKYKSKKRAENIERALYMCPHCGKISAITSKGTHFSCTNCGSVWEYTEDLHIAPNDKFDTVFDWYQWEKEELTRIVNTTPDFTLCDNNIEFYQSIRFEGKQKLAGNTVIADCDGVSILQDGNVTNRFLYKDMTGLAIVRRNKFEFYTDGKTYQVKGDDRFCSIKYVHLYEGVK